MRSLGTILLMLLTIPCGNAAEPALAAVGQLLVPGIRYEDGRRRHYDERCSATLVATPGARESVWLLTAWHCIEYYRDLSRDISFLHSGGERAIAMPVTSGGGMHADWALLRLSRALPLPVSLTAHPAAPGTALVLAGYPRPVDSDLSAESDAARPLEIARGCAVTSTAGRDLASDCHARRGASGGAVFAAAEAGGHYLGVLSRGDSDRESIFVPLTRLVGALRPYLEVPAPL